MKNKIYNQLSEKYVDVEGKRIARVPSNINYIKENHHPTYNFIKSLEAVSTKKIWETYL